MDYAVDLDIIEKSGAWFSYKGERLGQGRDKVKQLLRENEALREEIASQVYARHQEALDAAAAARTGSASHSVPAAAPASAPAEPVPEDLPEGFLDIDPTDDDL